MTHYSPNPGHVQCIQFKPSGKYYSAFVIDMTPYYNESDIHDAVRKAIMDKLNNPDVFNNSIFTVDDPYHVHTHPIMLVPEVMWRAHPYFEVTS